MDNLRSEKVAAVDTSTMSSTFGTSNPSISVINLELLRQVKDLSADLKALPCEVHSIRGLGRTVQRGGHRWYGSCSSRPRRTPESADWLCRYHSKFRDAARRCEAPCNWVNKKEN
ncbi:hypothetical protein O0L34_g19144 [Tuta absoluta]|nr:hypothetical protein O0L34_g19144 [Tuta absoluta]